MGYGASVLRVGRPVQVPLLVESGVSLPVRVVTKTLSVVAVLLRMTMMVFWVPMIVGWAVTIAVSKVEERDARVGLAGSVEETVSDTVEETIPGAVEEAISDMVEETVSDTVEETVEEMISEMVPEMVSDVPDIGARTGGSSDNWGDTREVGEIPVSDGGCGKDNDAVGGEASVDGALGVGVFGLPFPLPFSLPFPFPLPLPSPGWPSSLGSSSSASSPSGSPSSISSSSGEALMSSLSSLSSLSRDGMR